MELDVVVDEAPAADVDEEDEDEEGEDDDEEEDEEVDDEADEDAVLVVAVPPTLKLYR